MVKKAAEDARHNAELNGLDNVAIYTGKAEQNMNAVLSQCAKYNTVGIVDPPRAGLCKFREFCRLVCTQYFFLFLNCGDSVFIRKSFSFPPGFLYTLLFPQAFVFFSDIVIGWMYFFIHVHIWKSSTVFSTSWGKVWNFWNKKKFITWPVTLLKRFGRLYYSFFFFS